MKVSTTCILDTLYYYVQVISLTILFTKWEVKSAQNVSRNLILSNWSHFTIQISLRLCYVSSIEMEINYFGTKNPVFKTVYCNC